MKTSLKRLTIPFIAMALPFFAVEMFIGFLILNVVNNISEVTPLIPLNINIYR